MYLCSTAQGPCAGRAAAPRPLFNPLGTKSRLMQLLGQVDPSPPSWSAPPAAPAPHLGRGQSPAPAQLPQGLRKYLRVFPQGVWEAGLCQA